MSQERNPNTTEPLLNISKTVWMLQCGMEILAAPHRLIHYKFGSPGARAIDRFTWIGAFAAPAAFTARWPPETWEQQRNVAHAWQGLLLLAVVHSAASFWNRRPRHSKEVGRPRFGWLEIPVALVFAYFVAGACGIGAGAFLLAALVANQLLLLSISARYRRAVAIRHDGQIEAENIRYYSN